MKSNNNCCFRVVLAVVAFGVISYLTGSLWHVFESAWNVPELKGIWRPMNAVHWKYMPLGYALQAVVFVCIYLCLGRAMSCCPCPFTRGFKFGFKLWLLASLVNTTFWFISENITMNVAVLNLVAQLIAYTVGGAAVSKILGDSIFCCDEGEGKSKKSK